MRREARLLPPEPPYQSSPLAAPSFAHSYLSLLSGLQHPRLPEEDQGSEICLLIPHTGPLF